MLTTIRDDTWNVLNMQHRIPNSKRWDYSDIPGAILQQVYYIYLVPDNDYSIYGYNGSQQEFCYTFIKTMAGLILI